MLSKEDVLKNFLKEDTEDVIKVYQYMNLAYNKGIPTFTKFFANLIFGCILLRILMLMIF